MAHSPVIDAAEPATPREPLSTRAPFTRIRPPVARIYATIADRFAAFTGSRLFWLGPALLTAACAGWRLDGAALWTDELATWGTVRLSWGQLMRLLGTVDGAIAPYYLLVKAWTTVAGTSTAALRLPSVLAMTCAAALVAVLGARIGTRTVGMLAGLLFALVPVTSRYAQEARPYAFAILFAVLATLMLVRFLERPGLGTGAAYALGVALVGAFHVIGLLILVAHAVAVGRRFRPWLVAAACGTLPVLPLVWLAHRQSGQLSWIPPLAAHTVIGTPAGLFIAPEVGGALIVLALLAVRYRYAGLLFAWALVPVAALAVAGEFTRLFWPRYLLFTAPAWVLLAALALQRLARPHALGIVLAVAVLGAPGQTSVRAPDGHGVASAQAGAVIATRYRPGDAIAYDPHDSAVWEARDVVARYVPADRRPADVFTIRPPRTDGHLAPVECADPEACLDRYAPPRVWVVRLQNPGDPLANLGTKGELLRERYHLAGVWVVRGLTVALYAG